MDDESRDKTGVLSEQVVQRFWCHLVPELRAAQNTSVVLVQSYRTYNQQVSSLTSPLSEERLAVWGVMRLSVINYFL